MEDIDNKICGSYREMNLGKYPPAPIVSLCGFVSFFLGISFIFQIYDLENPQHVGGIYPRIRLKSQFDEEGAEFARLQSLKKIVNPVQKDDEDMFNKHGSLVWYSIESSDPAAVILVKFENQFGVQKIVIYCCNALSDLIIQYRLNI